MTQRTLEGLLHPDGTLTLLSGALPERPVRVRVTIEEGPD
jgi:hypothetical protein